MRYEVHELGDGMRPTGLLGRVSAVSIERGCTDEVPMLESAAVEFDADAFGWEGGWHRIDAIDGARLMLGCFLLEPVDEVQGHGCVTVKAEGRSVLAPAADASVPCGSYALAGSDAASFAASMLSVCPGTVSIAGQERPLLPSTVVFGDGSTRLSAAWDVLRAVGWCMRLPGDGSVILQPLPDEPTVHVSAYDSAGMEPGVRVGGGQSWTREWDGESRPFDVAEVELPRLGLSGCFRILTQSMTSGGGMEVGETAEEA